MSEQSAVQVSERVQKMTESATLAMAQSARDLKAKGHNVISLATGEPDFDTPRHIKQAAKKALDAGYTKYTPVPGLMELREAICTKFARDNDLHFKPSQIVVSNGAKQSIFNLCHALLNKGDEVIIFAPYWVSYSAIVTLAGGTPVELFAGIEQDYKVTPEQVAGAITDKTKMILFSSPCNPTGSVYSKEELGAIAQVIGKHKHICIVADEIYEYINFTGEPTTSIGSFDSVKEQTVTVNGFAKGFAMTGWRLGYIGAPLHIAEACSKLQGQCTSGASSFGQMAAAHALLSDLKPTYKMTRAYLKRKKMVIRLLKKIKGIKVNNPEGAFYVFPNISSFFGKSDGKTTITNSEEFSNFILNNAHVATVPGSSFGAEGYMRLSYAESEEVLKDAISRIEEAVAKLK